MIDDRTAFGQGLADEFVKDVKRAGGAQIVSRQFTNDKATDFNAILTQIRAQRSGRDLLRRHGRGGRPHAQADEGARHRGDVRVRRRRLLGKAAACWPATRWATTR